MHMQSPSLRRQRPQLKWATPVSKLVDRVVYNVVRQAKKRRVAREWNSNNPGRVVARVTQWRKDNHEHWKATVRKRVHERYHSEAQFNVRTRLRGILSVALKTKNMRKHRSVVSLYGCNHAELEAHLTSTLRPGATLLNQSIDHVFPMSAYDLTDKANHSRCMHWSNLRMVPMFGPDSNREKQCQLPSLQLALTVHRDRWPPDIDESMLV